MSIEETGGTMVRVYTYVCVYELHMYVYVSFDVC